MSITSGYDQYLRKYKLTVIRVEKQTVTKIVKKTVLVTPEVPPTPSVTTYSAKVKATKLNMRSGPGTKYKSYGTLKKGTKVELLTKSGRWYKAKHSKGKDGIVYLYYRYVKVTGTNTTAGSAGQAAVYAEVDETITETVEVETNAIDISNLRCVFNCEKDMNDTPNYSIITVYNMSQKTIASIRQGDKVILEAGYEHGNYGMIFTGNIVQPMAGRESGTDVTLTLVCQDGDVYLNSSFTATTLAKASSNADVVRVCTNGRISTGLVTDQLGKTKLARGKVVFGKSSKYVRKAAISAKSQFYIEDGTVNIAAASDYASNVAVELNPKTGLIGMPQQTDDGVSGQCLINPSIKLNTLIHINSSLVLAKQVEEGETSYSAVSSDGVYRITKLAYEGDTHGDPWYCTFEAVTQTGAKPTGMNLAVSNPWR